MLSPNNISQRNETSLFRPDRATVISDEQMEKEQAAAQAQTQAFIPLRVPQFTAEQYARKYKFDVRQEDLNGEKPERKIDLFRRIQEAHILMNALPAELREHEFNLAKRNNMELSKLKSKIYGLKQGDMQNQQQQQTKLNL